MDYTALDEELHNDPQNMGYQSYIDSGNKNKILDLLQKDDPSGSVIYESLSSEKATRIAAETGAYAAIKADAEDGSSSTQSHSLAAMDTLRKKGADFALHLKGMRDMLDALVNNGVITSNERDKFIGASQRPARREEAVLGRGVSVTLSDLRQLLN